MLKKVFNDGDDRRSPYPYWVPDPITPARRWQLQQVHRDCPWGEIEEPKDVRAERETREAGRGEVRSSGYIWSPGGVVRPAKPGEIEALEEKKRAAAAELAAARADVAGEPTCREAASIHECSHAAVAAILQLRIKEVTVAAGGGKCALDGAVIDTSDRDHAERLAAFLAAGRAGEERAYGRAYSDPQQDDARLVELAKRVGADPEAFRAKARARAKATLDLCWSTVQSRAALLLERGKLGPEYFQLKESVQGAQVRREMLPMMVRSATLQAAGGDEYDVVFSTGATVRRRDAYGDSYDEQLLMGASNVDMSRLASGKAPLLASHDSSALSSVIGVVTSAKLENGVGLARVRLSSREDVKGIAQDVRDKILHQVSVGYAVLAAERVQRAGDVPLLRVTSWRPAELSLVALGADPMASIRSDAPKFEAVVRV